MSYDLIDRFLRNNLGDDDYKEYSAALDELYTPKREWVGLTDEEINLWVLPDNPILFEFVQFIEAKIKEKQNDN